VGDRTKGKCTVDRAKSFATTETSGSGVVLTYELAGEEADG
jgi:hypothetical protein